jgi:spermidine synthase
MRRFETLDDFTTPDGHRLSLHHRDGDYFIDLDGHELMSTRVHASESALAELACARLPPARQRRPRVLIGGLGLGFTLAAALEALPANAEVVVAEVFPQVVEWHARHLQSLAVPLDDPRLRVHLGDVGDLLGGGPRASDGSRLKLRDGPAHRKDAGPAHRYDAILLDTDNGPDAHCRAANAALYDDAGIERIARSLAPGGVLAVWSAHPDAAFARRLRGHGFSVSTETIRGHRGKGARHVIFLASVETTSA